MNMLQTGAVPSSEWHAIRPWTSRIALQVRAITSVSVTFVLSTTYGTRASHDGHIPALHTFESNSGKSVEDANTRSAIAVALAKGLSVEINGKPWQRVLMRINDANGKEVLSEDADVDEAIVFIYGLIPGRKYEIDLELAKGEVVRQVIATDGTINIQS